MAEIHYVRRRDVMLFRQQQVQAACWQSAGHCGEEI
jgi:hypothetical protein